MSAGTLLHALVDPVDRPEGLLVLAHGYGQNESYIALIGRLIDPTRRFTVVAPRGPVDLRAGRPEPKTTAAAWDLPNQQKPEQFRSSLCQLADLVDEQCDRHKIAPEQVILGGFSQGAILALALAATPGRPTPAGVVMWCGAVPLNRGVEVELERLATVPLLVHTATQDEVIPRDVSTASVATLRESGADPTVHEFDGTHEITLDMLSSARSWLSPHL